MYPDSQQLFVGNLPHNCTESDLESLFSQFGKVIIIRIIRNNIQGINMCGRGASHLILSSCTHYFLGGRNTHQQQRSGTV